jgi:hypothetical protein
MSRNVILEGYTVTYVALQMACCINFNNVFLTEVVHNYQYEGRVNEVGVMEGDDLNHFCANCFKEQKWQVPDLKNL